MHAPSANPLRLIGFARCLAGAWFIATAISMLRDYDYLLPQAERLFRGEMGGTSAPIRSLLVLILAVVILVTGIRVLVRAVRWLRRRTGVAPAPLTTDEVATTLREHRLPAFAPGLPRPPWPIRPWLEDDLGRIAGWRRDMLATAVRTLARTTTLALLIAAGWLVAASVAPSESLGPFPFRFVILYPFVASVWASLALLLIEPAWPRVESVELPVPVPLPGDEPDQVIESAPELVGREPPALGTTIALIGVATQCLLVAWWQLGTLDYPHLAITIGRHLGAIIGGALFFVLGGRMITAGTDLIRRVQYDSIVAMLDRVSGDRTARAAAVRTESRDPDGERYIVSAVGGAHAREAARKLLLLH